MAVCVSLLYNVPSGNMKSPLLAPCDGCGARALVLKACLNEHFANQTVQHRLEAAQAPREAA